MDKELIVESDTLTPSAAFKGAGEAILAVSDNADEGIKDLVDAYNSEEWDNKEEALKLVTEYANKLRQKTPGPQNLLTPEETIKIIGMRTEGYIEPWEEKALSKVKSSEDPNIRAYEDLLSNSIEEVATSAIQVANNAEGDNLVDEIAMAAASVVPGAALILDQLEPGQFADKTTRVVLGAIPGTLKALGAEKYLQRSLRADSNDTFASTFVGGAGSVLALPVAAANIIMNAGAFGVEQYNESRNAGASTTTALVSAGIEGTNQALDVILDKLIYGGKATKQIKNFVAAGGAKAFLEGGQEYVQNKVSDAADFVGLTKENKEGFIKNFITPTKADVYAATTGAILGGATHIGMDAASNQAPPTDTEGDQYVPPDIAQEPDVAAPELPAGSEFTPAPSVEAAPLVSDLGLTQDYQILPPVKVSVIGEPVNGSPEVTTVAQASEGVPVGILGSPFISTDQNENIYINDDGSSTRVINGEEKQSHKNAIIVSPETAQKISQLQVADPGDGPPIVPVVDDLGRVFFQHPNVSPELTLQEAAVPAEPVLIPSEETGHVLQVSERTNELGSIEVSSTLSKGKTSGGVSSVGAQQVAVSTVADKLKSNPNINDNIKDLLGLGEDFAFGLTYVPNTNDQTLARVDATFAAHDNNYVQFANDLLSKDWENITPVDATAATFAIEAISKKADEIRLTNPEAAAQYDTLGARLATVAVARRGQTAQELQSYSTAPWTGATLLAGVRADAENVAIAKTAEELQIPVRDIENIQQETKLIDAQEAGIAVRQTILNEQEVVAQETHDAADKQVDEIEKAITTIDDTGPEVIEAQKAVDEAVQEEKTVEAEAAALEKQAVDIENAQEIANEKIAALTKEIEDLTKAPEPTPDNSEVEKLVAAKDAIVSPEAAPKVVAAKEKLSTAKKGSSEKATARVVYQKILDDQKLEAKKENARLDAEITSAKQRSKQALEEKKAAKKASLNAKKEELAAEKKKLSKEKTAAADAKKKEAEALRASKKAERVKAQEALKDAKAKRLVENSARKALLKEQLTAAKEARKASAKERKAQLDAEKARIKAEKETLNVDREKLQVRRDRNKRINNAVDRYKKQFAAKLTPEQIARVNELTALSKTLQGEPQRRVIEELGKTLAKLRGVDLLPGSDPWQTIWQGNVLLNVGTNISNITGNIFSPVYRVISDIGRGNFKQANNFIRAWVSSAILSPRRLKQDVFAGLRGDLPARKNDLVTAQALKDIESGLTVAHENDPIRIAEGAYGSGKLGQILRSPLLGSGKLIKLISFPMISLRALGAMDAVFSRAAKEGYIAREAPSYDAYLAAKAANYDQYLIQARNELAQLNKLDISVGKEYVNRRADELYQASLPAERQAAINASAQRDVFQAAPRGGTARFVGGVLKAVGNYPFRQNVQKDINAKNGSPLARVSYAFGFANKTARDNMGVDEIYPIVVQGLSQGKTLVINGKDVNTSSTKQVLGEIVDAVLAKQVISLKGDSIRPFQYAIGQFVNTASAILDASIEQIPVVGLVDQLAGGKFTERTLEERKQLYGTQFANTVVVAGLLGALIPQMDDEENANFYIYGPMLDANLRKYYEAKGIRPNSFRVGGRTFIYKDVPGLNLIFGGIGAVADAFMVAKRTPERPLTIGAGLQAASIGALYTASQATMLKNVSVLTDLISLNDARWTNSVADIFTNIVGGQIPFSGPARELDRFIYGDLSRPKDTLNRMLQAIPIVQFLSDREPALNMFGKPIRTTVTPGVSRFTGTAAKSPEIDWLLNNGYTVTLPKTGSKITEKQLANYAEMRKSDEPENFEPYLTEKDQRRYMELFGPRLESIIRKYSSSYPQGFKPYVQKRMDSEVKEWKARIKNQILRGN